MVGGLRRQRLSRRREKHSLRLGLWMLVDHLAGRAKRGHDDRGLDFPKTPESAISAQHLLAKNRSVCYRLPMIGSRAGPAPIGRSAMTGEKKERNKQKSAGFESLRATGAGI